MGLNDEDKPIQKKILSSGKTAAEFNEGAKIHFHFQAKLSESGQILDDSRKWTKPEPMELVVGKKFKLEVWETCLKMMSVGEVAEFRVKKSLTYAYPTVAKTLRDSFDPRRLEKKAAGADHGHMCGMMAMQVEGGLGYDDLNELMKRPEDLTFIFDLIDVQEEYKRDNWQLSNEERLQKIPDLKASGNESYKKGQIDEASVKYKEALGLLEQLMLREKPEDEEWLKLRGDKIPLLLNYSQCKLMQGNFYEVIEHCDEILSVDSDNVKGLFRRAKAHKGAWNPKEAKEDFNRVARLDPHLKEACAKEVRVIEEMERRKDEEDKEKLKKLFAS